MSYEKTIWVDHIVDPETGEVIQQGTRFTEARANKMEQGIFDNDARSIGNKEKLDNSFYADLEAYYGNTKLIDDFQDVSGYAAGGSVQSADFTNVKVGKQSLRLTENDNVPAFLYTTKSFALDASKLNNGEEFSDEDYIVGVVYISDIAKFEDYVTFNLCSQEPYSSSNFAEVRESVSNLNTGWNYIKKKKSEVNVYGASFDWSDIKTIRVTARSVTNAQDAYVSFQLLQLVKADPSGTYPNPLQRNGIREFDYPESVEPVVIEEFGEICIKPLADDYGISRKIVGQKKYTNFIASLETECKLYNRSGYLAWEADANNRIWLETTSAGDARIIVQENGVNTLHDFEFPNLAVGDRVKFMLEKNGNTVLGTFTLSGGYTRTFYAITNLTQEGSLAVYTNANNPRCFSASITEISHAHHADIAEVAKRLTEQAYARIKNSISQSIANGVVSGIVFDTVEDDNRNHYNGVDGITIREQGIYYIAAGIRIQANGTGERYIALKHGNTIISSQRVGASSQEMVLQVSTVYRCLKNYDITVVVYQSGETALNVIAATDYSPYLAIAKIG